MNGSLPDWGDVLATALVGTQRRTVRPFGASTMDDPADVLLDAAATLAVYRRAGFVARVADRIGSERAEAVVASLEREAASRGLVRGSAAFWHEAHQRALRE